MFDYSPNVVINHSKFESSQHIEVELGVALEVFGQIILRGYYGSLRLCFIAFLLTNVCFLVLKT